MRVKLLLALIRNAGKPPTPIISVTKSSSHVSSSSYNDSGEDRIEMDYNVLFKGGLVVIVDDVLATGRTLCAALQLLGEAGISVADISVIVVAEFPIHRGRELLRSHGFGGVQIRSLLFFGGA